MNKTDIIEKVKKYISQNYNCGIEELEKNGLNIIKNNSEKQTKDIIIL